MWGNSLSEPGSGRMDETIPWAEEEFGAADLGDARRTARLVQLAAALGAQPHASLPQATHTSALRKAAYRFFGSQYVASETILASHVHATQQRMQAVPLVLAVQDTTLLDYTPYPDTDGLGPLATGKQRGLLAHTTLALTPERVPLGLLAQQVWARDPDGRHSNNHKTRPITEKESHKWLTSLEATIAARAACPQTQFVSVGDREADVYDLFLVERPVGVDLLVRAAQNRKVDGPESVLWAAMATAPVAATVELTLGERGNQPARHAELTIRWRQVSIRPPKHRDRERLPPITVWAVWAIERTPPPGVEAVEWLLLTTVAVETTDDALERLGWYAARWGIEVWHKVLKSGCRIEEKQLGTAYRLTTCLTLSRVIAWRLLFATMLARAVPDAPCTVFFDEAEWKGLYCRIHRVSIAPITPPSLQQAGRWVAQLGGFLGRRSDGEPGVLVMWNGLQRLADIAEMYRILHQPPSNSASFDPD